MNLVNREPVVALASFAAVIVVVAGMFDIVVEPSDVETFLSAGVILVTALVQRRKVAPVSNVV